MDARQQHKWPKQTVPIAYLYPWVITQRATWGTHSVLSCLQWHWKGKVIYKHRYTLLHSIDDRVVSTVRRSFRVSGGIWQKRNASGRWKLKQSENTMLSDIPRYPNCLSDNQWPSQFNYTRRPATPLSFLFKCVRLAQNQHVPLCLIVHQSAFNVNWSPTDCLRMSINTLVLKK